MTIFPFLIPSAILLLVFFGAKLNHDQATKQLKTFREKFKTKITYEKKSVKAKTYTIGRKNSTYRFRKCDLIFFENGLAIVPFYNIGKYKCYSNFLLISDNLMIGEDKLKKIDLNASGNDVRIEFGEPSFFTTNVEIRLKNLTSDEKNLIKIVESRKS